MQENFGYVLSMVSCQSELNKALSGDLFFWRGWGFAFLAECNMKVMLLITYNDYQGTRLHKSNSTKKEMKNKNNNKKKKKEGGFVTALVLC
jgi:hypothetical protein